MRKITTIKNETTKTLSPQEQKNLRRAEARHRIELLQEAKLLHDHLADFWDDSLELSTHRRALDMRLYPAELAQILEPDKQTQDQQADENTLIRRPITSAYVPRTRVPGADDSVSNAQLMR